MYFQHNLCYWLHSLIIIMQAVNLAKHAVVYFLKMLLLCPQVDIFTYECNRFHTGLQLS